MKILLNKKTLLIFSLLKLFQINHVIAHESDDPLLSKLMIDQLEWRDGENSNPFTLEGQAWIGHDRNKLWLKFDAEKSQGSLTQAETQVLLSHAIAPFWDLQTGVRIDSHPSPSNKWLAIGVQGLAPYFFDVDGAFFIGESAHTAARFSASYDLHLTQRWILSPSIQVNAYGQDDDAKINGKGLSELQSGLRLRYEIVRECAPYLGINWNQKFGNTAEFSKQRHEAKKESEFVMGVKIWY